MQPNARYLFTVVGILALTHSTLAEPALTIYNQQFAVVRDTLELDLKTGSNSVSFSDVTAHLEPDSVILRDPDGKVPLQILEQNYRADPVTQGLLLNHYEGKTISFLITSAPERIVEGRIVRAGYQPHRAGLNRYGQNYYQTQMAYAYGESSQPIIEIDGKLRFGLPGTPLFPSLANDDILKPTLEWVIETDRDTRLISEIAYLTGGMSWEADYNVIAPPEGDLIDLVGWITMDNQSGKTFDQARIKLLAGDVNKIQPPDPSIWYSQVGARREQNEGMRPVVSEKSFDEYHLYTLREPTTLRDRQTKQVEFVRAENVKSKRLYVYDGVYIDYNQYQNYRHYRGSIISDQNYGTQSNPKVWIMREFNNTEGNNLGIPLPAGRLRFYRSDDDRRLEFVGENMIDHTPKDEKVRVYTGNAFDLVGERRQKAFEYDSCHARETIEIKLRNHKETAVQILAVEHLYRYSNWEIKDASHKHRELDAATIEFPVTVKPDEEVTITYTVHYYCYSTQKTNK